MKGHNTVIIESTLMFLTDYLMYRGEFAVPSLSGSADAVIVDFLSFTVRQSNTKMD